VAEGSAARRAGGRARRSSPLRGSRARGLARTLLPDACKVHAGTLSQPPKWRMQRRVLGGFSSYWAPQPRRALLRLSGCPAQPLPPCDVYQHTSAGDSHRNTKLGAWELPVANVVLWHRQGTAPARCPRGRAPFPRLGSSAPASRQAAANAQL